jgi:hypothetical protein
MLFVGRFDNSLSSLTNLEIAAMNHNSDDRKPEDKEAQETGGEDFDLQLDDLDDEIIDLVDPVEGEDRASDDPSASNDEVDDENELALGDLDLEVELGEDESDLDATLESLEDEEKSAAAVETEVEERSTAQEVTADTAAAAGDDALLEEDLVTDEALAELFASHESEVAQLLEEASGAGEEDTEVASAQPATPVTEEDLSEDLFADLDTELGDVSEEPVSAEAGPVTEEDLPEDLFADLEAESVDVSEQAVDEVSAMVAGEEATGDIDTDLEGESKDVSEEVAEELSPDAAEELAALFSAQVESVVTRLVEERLPAIVESAIAQEIEKIRTSLESEK